MAFDFPIMLDVTARTVVIVGGGAVAARKARALLAAGAIVRCVSPAFHADLPDAVLRVAGEYDPSHLDGAFLVFAATNSPDVNDRVVREAMKRALLVTRADLANAAEDGNFVMPAVHRDGPVTLAVSTGSPALAAVVRDELAANLEAGWAELAASHAQLRPLLLKALAPSVRGQILRKLSTRTAMDINSAGGAAALIEWVRKEHPEIGPTTPGEPSP